MTLNEKQQEAVNHREGPCLVLAGAGSGKTRVLTERIIKLINDGVDPHNILAITFTNKAAKEMKSRVEEQIGYLSEQSFIGTFHSFGLRILRENYFEIGYTANITILDTDDTKALIKRIIKEDELFLNDQETKRIINIINKAKSEDTFPDDFQALSIYEKYIKLLQENNSVDFDDLLLKPVKLLKSNPNILERYQEKYKYILVDEYQDTNSIQYELCKLLASKYHNIFVVGDANQSIYSWRNADYRNILNFEKDYKDAKVILLEENYRSTNNILKAANSVIKNNTEGKKLNLWTSSGDGEKVTYLRVSDEIKEAAYAIDKIKELVSYGYKYDDFAILYRTNAQSRVVEDALLQANLPYNIIGSYYFYSRKEIKDLIAYLKVIYNSSDSVSLERVINVPKRGIGTKTIDSLREKASEKGCSMFDAIESGKELEWKKMVESLIEESKSQSLSELVENVLFKTGIRKEYEDDDSLESAAKVENLNEFKSVALSFEENGIYDLQTFLENLMLVSDRGQYVDSADNIHVMTLHSAKGLEFKIVFILGMEEGLFPYNRNNKYATPIDEEERRLCYVGITRAKIKLFLLSSEERMIYGEKSKTKESRFVEEIDKDVLEIKGNTSIGNIKSTKNVDVKEMYSSNEAFHDGDKVTHSIFGDGIIVSIRDKVANIAFKNGIKTIALNHKYLSKKER